MDNQQQRSNGLGIAGFVLALIAVFVSWIPILGWIIWILGAVFSIIGIFKGPPRGLAIAGTILSFIDLILLVFVASAIGGMLALFS